MNIVKTRVAYVGAALLHGVWPLLRTNLGTAFGACVRVGWEPNGHHDPVESRSIEDLARHWQSSAYSSNHRVELVCIAVVRTNAPKAAVQKEEEV